MSHLGERDREQDGRVRGSRYGGIPSNSLERSSNFLRNHIKGSRWAGAHRGPSHEGLTGAGRCIRPGRVWSGAPAQGSGYTRVKPMLMMWDAISPHPMGPFRCFFYLNRSSKQWSRRLYCYFKKAFMQLH